MEAEQLRLRRESDKLRANNPTGALASGLQNQLDDMERKSLSKQADIAILGNAAGRRYDTALSIAKDKVEMLMAPKKAELEGLKYIQENNKAFQTAEFSNLLNRKNAEYEREMEEKNLGNAMIIEATARMKLRITLMTCNCLRIRLNRHDRLDFLLEMNTQAMNHTVALGQRGKIAPIDRATKLLLLLNLQ
jgi:hypothetical protein